MTITALRLVAGAYASARANGHPAQKPFSFNRKAAMFLLGVRGRDVNFRRDGTPSIWTVVGRKRISYNVPEGLQLPFRLARMALPPRVQPYGFRAGDLLW